MSNEQREAAWAKYAQENIGEFGQRARFDAGWYAAMAAKAEPVQIDRLPITKAQIEEILRSNDVYEPDPDSDGWRLDVSVAAAAIIVALAAQPQLTFSERECQNGPESDIAAQPVTGTAEWDGEGWTLVILPNERTYEAVPND